MGDLLAAAQSMEEMAGGQTGEASHPLQQHKLAELEKIGGKCPSAVQETHQRPIAMTAQAPQKKYSNGQK